jgi:nucleoid-associated protein YgaU
VYGSSKYWTIIYDANEELITDPETLELTGQKLWLPNKPAEGGQ